MKIIIINIIIAINIKTIIATIISIIIRLKLVKYLSASTAISRSSPMTVDGLRALDHPEPVLLLHTSGASGNMKYIGGIVRNLFTSILSGGSVISCNGFDPHLLYNSATAADVIYKLSYIIHIGNCWNMMRSNGEDESIR